MAGDVTRGFLRRLGLNVDGRGDLTLPGNLIVTGVTNLVGGYNDVDVSNVAITTVGNGLLTAAGINGGLITRSGPTGPYSDTTDTAAAILAGITNPFVGQAFFFTIKNTTSFTQTLLAGSGVTLPTTVTIGGLSSGTYYATITGIGASAAVTFAHFYTVPTNPRLATLRSSAQTDATTTTLANITGLSGMPVVIGTYQFTIDLVGVCGGTGGWKLAFNYNTTVLSAINYTAIAYSGGNTVAVTNGTTTTNQTSIIAANTAYTNARIVGTMVVSTAGTVDLQFAENSANSTSSIFLGSTMVFSRIA